MEYPSTSKSSGQRSSLCMGLSGFSAKSLRDVSSGNPDVKSPKPVPIPIAIRVYPEPPVKQKGRSNKRLDRPETMLVLDTETTTDATQRLLFGSYRFIDRSRCVEEGLFYPDDLSSDQLSILQDYVRTHRADTVKRRPLKLSLIHI